MPSIFQNLRSPSITKYSQPIPFLVILGVRISSTDRMNLLCVSSGKRPTFWARWYMLTIPSAAVAPPKDRHSSSLHAAANQRPSFSCRPTVLAPNLRSCHGTIALRHFFSSTPNRAHLRRPQHHEYCSYRLLFYTIRKSRWRR
jgi:hypothetical protein